MTEITFNVWDRHGGIAYTFFLDDDLVWAFDWWCSAHCVMAKA